MKFIIIDLRTERALYGFNAKTLIFSSRDIALEVAQQFFENSNNYLIVGI